MAKFSRELLNMLSEFMITEIGASALDGITYALVAREDTKRYKQYLAIREEANKCGFNSNEVFRFHELINGYIFDMDILTAKQITAEISRNVAAFTKGKTPIGELLKERPEKRRLRDLEALSKVLKAKYDSGVRNVEVALFSKNSTNKITIHGKGPNNKRLAIVYNAYAIRHWDIELLNERFLIPANFRVSSLRPCELLPSKTGVSFLFTLESMDDYFNRMN